MTDLVKRLRHQHANGILGYRDEVAGGPVPTPAEAADHIETIERENAELRERVEAMRAVVAAARMVNNESCAGISRVSYQTFVLLDKTLAALDQKEKTDA